MRRAWGVVLATVALGAQLAAQEATPIDGVAMVRTMSADPIALTMALRYDAYVLFRGGVSMRGIPAGAPSSWNAEALARSSPQYAGRWRESGGALQITTTRGDVQTFKDWFRMTPGGRDERLEGVWKGVGAIAEVTGGRSSTASAIRGLALHSDGRFDGALSGGASTGGVVTAVQRGSAGRYRIDGFEIEFTYEDGRVVRQLFCFSSSDHQTLQVQGARLIKQR